MQLQECALHYGAAHRAVKLFLYKMLLTAEHEQKGPCKIFLGHKKWGAIFEIIPFSPQEPCSAARGSSRKKYLGGLAPHHFGGNNG